MSRRVEAPARAFREFLRGFRVSLTHLMSMFQSDEVAARFAKLRPILDVLDEDLRMLLRSKGNNEKVTVINTCLDEHVNGVDLTEIADFLKSEISAALSGLVSEAQSMLDSGSDEKLDNLKKVLSSIPEAKNLLETCSSMDPPALGEALFAIWNVFEKTVENREVVNRSCQMFRMTCILNASLKGLNELPRLPILSEDEEVNMDLQAKVAKLRNELKDGERRCSDLMHDKIQRRRMKIDMDRENKERQAGIISIQKNLERVQLRTKEYAPMVDVLEMMAAVMKAPRKTAK